MELALSCGHTGESEDSSLFCCRYTCDWTAQRQRHSVRAALGARKCFS